MTQTVSMPLWAFLLIVLFAGVTFASHFLFPSVRWFFRRRAERVIAQVNQRLQRPIEPFKLARRYDMIQRLIYDPQVTQAIAQHAKKNENPESVSFEMAKRFAREIVPSFSATAYFSIGIRMARWLSESLYDVKVEVLDYQKTADIDSNATVIFVMNHRSNMDYVLVTYLAAQASALSYAVGEWARVWPLSAIIRSMGAYFIRRNSRGALYRKVLARYVQMATRGGVNQAVFPEGGLSLTGRTADPKVGLLSYIVDDFDPDQRDVVFVPVALNYDRVLEDTFLVTADKMGQRKFRPPWAAVIRGVGGHVVARLTGRFKGFGTAAVHFGEPLALSQFMSNGDGGQVEVLAAELMRRINTITPVLSVPLVAHLLLTRDDMRHDSLRFEAAKRLSDLQGIEGLQAMADVAKLCERALAQLSARGLISIKDGVIAISAASRDLLRYYANSIDHHLK